jgi:hypothetical protein
MANLPGVKTFVSLVEEVAQFVMGQTPADVSSGNPTNPTLTILKQIVNDAYREVLSKRFWYFLVDIKTLTLTSGQTTPYALDDTCDMPFYFRITAEAKRLNYIPYDEWLMRWPAGFTNMGNSSPLYYIPAQVATNGAKQVLLFPASDNSTRVVEYGFKKRVVDMTDPTDYMLIPAEWQDVVIKLAIFKSFIKRQDPDNAKPYFDLYTARLNEMMVWDINQTPEWINSIMDLSMSRMGSILGNYNQVAWAIGTGGIY